MRQVDAGNIVHASRYHRHGGDHAACSRSRSCSPCRSRRSPQVAAAMSQGSREGAGLSRRARSAARPACWIRGTLTVLDNQVDPTTGTIKLKATFPNPSTGYGRARFVGVRVQVDTAQGRGRGAAGRGAARAAAAPLSMWSIRTTPSKRRDVTVGHEDAQASIITDGVKPGDRVVMDGASRLTDGAQGDDRAAGGRRQPPAAEQPDGARDAAAAPGRGAARDGERDEHLRPLHRPSDRHLAAGDRDPAGRRAGLSRAAGVRPAARSISRPSRSPPSCPAPAPRRSRR